MKTSSVWKQTHYIYCCRRRQTSISIWLQRGRHLWLLSLNRSLKKPSSTLSLRLPSEICQRTRKSRNTLALFLLWSPKLLATICQLKLDRLLSSLSSSTLGNNLSILWLSTRSWSSLLLSSLKYTRPRSLSTCLDMLTWYLKQAYAHIPQRTAKSFSKSLSHGLHWRQYYRSSLYLRSFWMLFSSSHSLSSPSSHTSPLAPK